MKPLLLLDVDGVLNPFPDTPEGYVEYDFFPGDDQPVRLSATHGESLRTLTAEFDVVWASGWGAVANELICPLFELPGFPVIALPQAFEPRDKVPAIAAYARDRPAAWVDDLLTPEAHAWAASRQAPTLLVAVDSAVGLTLVQIDELRGWAAALRG